jgi:hypothetical protein
VPAAQYLEPGRETLIDRIGVAQDDPPIGIILVGWDRPDQADVDHGSIPTAAELESTYEHQVERSVIFAVTGCAGRADHILASTDAEVAVVRSALSGPASAEALAERIGRRLDAELDRLSISTGEPAVRWAIGVAVSRPDDAPDDLLRHAETALDDAWLLGGRHLVAFDRGNRDVLDRLDRRFGTKDALDAD